jgi:hypothetical protein
MNSLGAIWKVANSRKREREAANVFLQDTARETLFHSDASACSHTGQCSCTRAKPTNDLGFLQSGLHPNISTYKKNTANIKSDHICVHMDAYRKIYGWLSAAVTKGQRERYEEGGTFKVVDGELHVDKHVDGKKASIDIPHSKYEFHTHPGVCGDSTAEERSQCMLSTPSVADCVNVLTRGCKNGNIAHFVFAYEGVFVIVCKDPNYDLEQAKRQLMVQLSEAKKVVAEFVSSKTIPYMKTVSKWLKLLNDRRCPLQITFFPIGQAPCAPSDV